MYIKINGESYRNSTWAITDGVGKLTFQTEKSLSELEQEFSPEVAVYIEEYSDDDTLIHQWYNRNLQSIAYKRKEETDEWDVVAEFRISAFPYDENEEIRQSIEDSDDAVIELAGLIYDHEEELDDIKNVIATHTTSIGRFNSMLNSLADRVARLENKVGGENNG